MAGIDAFSDESHRALEAAACTYGSAFGRRRGHDAPTALGWSLAFGRFRLYPTARVVERDGARLDLGSRALDILIVLAERAGEVVSHNELNRRVWRGLVVTPNSLRVHIAALRKVLGEDEGESRYIANVPGQGYCFVAPIRRIDALEPGVSTAESPTSTLASFIGREKEQLKVLLVVAPLVPLTGPAGARNTCWLVELASWGGSASGKQTAANVIGIEEQGDSSRRDVTAERAATRFLLLALDNKDR